jgi:hypothetical protein
MCLLEGIRRVFPLKEALFILARYKLGRSLRIVWVIGSVDFIMIRESPLNEYEQLPALNDGSFSGA